MSGLVKAKKYDIEDSNIALLGSDLEKNVRANAAAKEPAWKTAGRKEGLEIWRIEKFQVVAWPEKQYGEFYSGDSYIVLRTYKKADDTKFSYDIHFWLGQDTTQDEAGTAAYKTVELDDFLNTTPVQHREVQNHESALFLSYFPKLKIENGGIESGFKKVKPEEYRHRLLRVKGVKDRVAVTEVPKAASSLNSGDVFILDAGLKIHQFNGLTSNGAERSKAMEFASALAKDRRVAKVTVFQQNEDLSEFWALLGDKGEIKGADQVSSDKDASAGQTKRLFRLSDASGKMEFKQECEGKVRKSNFDTNDVFVFDNITEVYVWIGKKATAAEKRLGLQYAQNYLTMFKRPAWLPISRVMENGENETFVTSLDPPESKVQVQKKGAEAKTGGAAAPVSQKK